MFGSNFFINATPQKTNKQTTTKKQTNDKGENFVLPLLPVHVMKKQNRPPKTTTTTTKNPPHTHTNRTGTN